MLLSGPLVIAKTPLLVPTSPGVKVMLRVHTFGGGEVDEDGGDAKGLAQLLD